MAGFELDSDSGVADEQDDNPSEEEGVVANRLRKDLRTKKAISDLVSDLACTCTLARPPELDMLVKKEN